ncbi:putative ankyrin repeat protein [Acanthamoeba polyphaga mimivirus]|uniref:Ankyrin repeat protein n=1 Tax=Acanthamoeba polyphaga mimivirus Kroon TaxID=3069720 RepID=A0A0G2Y5H5_9VIRU|nr:putative ankyrin repeat protein [Acanthamoeba polyphaga mimivirus]AKI79829.1 putative ankyrin repeat protein [Acanthamoeba polyphaga mimivirus Kroon]
MYLVINEKNSIKGHQKIVKHLKKKINKNNPLRINRQNSKGWSALMIASITCGEWCSIETVRLLLEHGADTNIQEKNSLSLDDIKYPYVHMISLINKIMRQKNSNSENGFTALSLVCAVLDTGESIEVVKLLLKYGANIDSINNCGETALIIACQNSKYFHSIFVIDLLLQNNTNILHKDNNGFTALIHAASHCPLSIIKLLVKNGSDVNATDNKGNSVLMYATKNNINIVLYLLKKGANINHKNNDNNNVLHFASKRHVKSDVIIFLLDKLSHPTEINANNNTILAHVCRQFNHHKNDTDTVKMLLENGANPNIIDDDSRTILMDICTDYQNENSLDIIEMLLKKGANINATDVEGHTALNYACISVNNKITIKIIKLLLKYSINVNHIDNDGAHILIDLCRNYSRYSLKIIKLLLEHSANVNVTFGKKKWTPLFFANENLFSSSEKDPERCIKLIDLLIDYGANVNAVDKYGNNILMEDITRNLECPNSITKHLLEKKININHQNDNGDTVLLLVYERYELERAYSIAQFLLEHGSNPNITNNDGKSILTILKNNIFWNFEKVIPHFKLFLNYNFNLKHILDLLVSFYANRCTFDLIMMLIDYGKDYGIDYISTSLQKIIENSLTSEEMCECIDKINTMRTHKEIMNTIIKYVPKLFPRVVSHPDGFCMQIMKLKWDLSSNNHIQITNEYCTKIMNYIGATDIHHLQEKLCDINKFM